MTSANCPHCGSAIPADAPEGLCLACLLHAGAEAGGNMFEEAGEALPRLFGEFELRRLLGRGGMGLVFAAWQKRLDRMVAVKVLASGLFADREARRRFRAEAQAVARMDHPGIVPVLEAGECEGQSFFSMPLLSGGTLAEALRAGKIFTCQEAAAFVAGLAHAVHYAHQRGVLHRDIKPANILLTEDGEPRLTDFGLARFLEKESTLTRTNAMLGTPAYMAPEQAQGSPATTAADIYGLGAVLYELLTGQPPFAGGTSIETVRLLLDTAPRRPSTLNPSVDRDLETVCLRCLDKDPARRYDSAAALAEDLERRLRNEPVTARRSSPAERLWKWTRRHPALAAAVTVAVLALLTGAVVSTVLNVKLDRAHHVTTELSEKRRAEVARLHAEECSAHLRDHDAIRAFAAGIESLAMEEAAPAGVARDAAVSRARERVAAVYRACPRLRHAWMHAESARDGILSPDGTLAVCLSGDVLTGYDTVTGAVRLGPVNAAPLDRGRTDGALQFDGTGRRLLCTGAANAVRTVRVLDLARTQWLWPAVSITANPLFSPDGSGLFVSTADGVRCVDTATGAPRLTLRATPATALALSTDGRFIALGDAVTEVFVYDAVAGAKLHGPLRAGDEGAVHQLVFSPDGEWLAACSGRGHAMVWRMPGAAPARPLVPNGGISKLVFSPDSKQLLTAGFQVSRVRDPSGMNLPGDLLPHPAFLSMAAFHPDSNLITTAGADGHIYFWEVKGNTETRARLHHASQVHTVLWSPDGRSVLTTGNDGVLKFWDLPAQDVSLVQIKADGPVSSLRWTAGGMRLEAFSTARESWDARTGETIPISPADAAPTGLPGRAALAPDETICAVSTGAAGEFEIRDSASQQRRHSLKHPMAREGTTLNFVFSPDSRHVLSVPHDSLIAACAAELWDLATGKPAGFSLRHQDGILCAAFSPDGSVIATGGEDFTARLWHTRDGTSAGALPPHVYWVWDVQFSPDGSRLATASADHTARVWDCRTLTAITPPLAHERIARRLAWHPDGTHLATADTRGFIRIWEVAADSRSVDELRALAARLMPSGWELGPSMTAGD